MTSPASPTFAGLDWSEGLRAAVELDAPLRDRVAALSDNVTFSVAVRNRLGRPLSVLGSELRHAPLGALRPAEGAMERVALSLEAKGLKIVRHGWFTLTARGPAALVGELLGRRMTVHHRPRIRRREKRVRADDLFLAPEPRASQLSVRHLHEEANDAFFAPPSCLYQPSATPPVTAYPSLSVLAIRRLLGVPSGLSGAGVKVAIVDTGFERHPYYTQGGFDLVSTSSGDPSGHGTAMPMNLLAVAPRASVRVFAESDGAPQDAVELAVEQGAQIVSLSFGWSDENVQPVLETTLRETRAKGVIVVVASGDGARSWPGDMPEILSVGGVFADLDDGDALQVSNLASGYISDQYPGRIVPDVCGLCGQKPLGTYIPMPCPAGSDFDRRYAESDGTAPDDGWFVGSGTSAAAPQVAGVIALLLEQAAAAGVPLSPPQIVHLLQQTCRVVSRGANAMDIGASGNRPNAACGFGLVDATAAIAALRTTPMV